ncbi:hypothetical protein C0J52_20970 [Blattella germanica]|nr:hypothetical protein C0J52_20970 [Blattella germanica]
MRDRRRKSKYKLKNSANNRLKHIQYIKSTQQQFEFGGLNMLLVMKLTGSSIHDVVVVSTCQLNKKTSMAH